MDIRNVGNDPNYVQKAIDDLQAMDADLKKMAEDCGDKDKVKADWDQYWRDANNYGNDCGAAFSSGQIKDINVLLKLSQDEQPLTDPGTSLFDFFDKCYNDTDKQAAQDAFSALDEVLTKLDVDLEPYAKTQVTAPIKNDVRGCIK
jgi:hypothetical protein